jgi:transcriptional regulator with XRE-family HTH domain
MGMFCRYTRFLYHYTTIRHWLPQVRAAGEKSRCTPMSSKRDSFNGCIAAVIRAMRRSRGVRQKEVAAALFMSECNYCKLEKNRREVTMGQLVVIADTLDSTVRNIVTLAETVRSAYHPGQRPEHFLVELYNAFGQHMLEEFRNEHLVEIFDALSSEYPIPRRQNCTIPQKIPLRKV